jgi:membrane protein YqaA with SNARE-associated domain
MSSVPAASPSPSVSLVQRLFARLQQWADAGWSGSVVLAWGLLQGCIFPGLADVFFLPLALARPQRAYGLALIATAGTLIGSVLLYVIGSSASSMLEQPLATWLGITAEHLAQYRTTLGQYGAWAIFASTMSPLSTKLTSIASGLAGVPWPAFVGALLAGRLVRTLGLAWLVRNGGAAAVQRWVKWPAASAE